MEELLMSVTSAACVGVGIAVGLLGFIMIAKQFLFIGRPNELLIFYGRGSSSQPLLGGGRRWQRRALRR